MNTPTLNVLILFSGTKSIEKQLDKCKDINFNHYSVDLDKRHSPTFNVDILKWDYKTDLKDINIHYIHGSPVCKEFSIVKTLSNQTRNLKEGFKLLDKCLEIIEYLKTKNPNLLVTIENPRNKYLRTYEPLSKYIRHQTSYCSYGFPYQKMTYFFSNFKIDFREGCSKKNPCNFRKVNNYHRVVLCYAKPDKYKLQIKDTEYLKEYRLSTEFDSTIKNITYLRYRLPPLLVDDIIRDMIKKYKDIKLEEEEKEEKEEFNICNECVERITYEIGRFSIDEYDKQQDLEQLRQEDYLSFIDYPDEEEGERYNCDICNE